MDGLSRTAGVGPTITLGDQTYETSTRVLKHYALIEAEMLKQRINPFQMLRMMAQELPDRHDLAQIAVHKSFEEVMSWGYVTEVDMYSWMETTTHGRCMTVWLSVKHNDSKPTFDDIRDRYCDQYDDIRVGQGLAAAEEWSTGIFGAVMQATGGDELGNLSGSPRSPETEETTGEG